MRAFVMSEPGSAVLEVVQDPTPAAGQVVVAVQRCGICGTDRHLFNGDNPFAKYPVIPGHEFAGVVVEVGSDVTRLRTGQRVAVDPSYFCGWCPQCREGYTNLCLRKGGYGSGKPGGLAELVAVTDVSCEPLADDASFAVGALAEPLACVLHGMDNLGPVLGHRVLLYGAGPIGLLAAGLLARGGAAEIVVIERDPLRAAATAAFGVSAVETTTDRMDPDDRFHVVVDATGNPAAMSDGLRRLRSGGRFLILGVAPRSARMEVSPFDINWRELKIIGSMSVRHTFGRAAAMLTDPALHLDRLVTSEEPLAKARSALDSLGAGGQLKVLIDPTSG